MLSGWRPAGIRSGSKCSCGCICLAYALCTPHTCTARIKMLWRKQHTSWCTRHTTVSSMDVCILSIWTTDSLSQCNMIPLWENKADQVHRANVMGYNSKIVIPKYDHGDGHLPHNHLFPRTAAKPTDPATSVKRFIESPDSHHLSDIRLWPLKWQIKADQACRARRASWVRRMWWCGLLLLAVISGPGEQFYMLQQPYSAVKEPPLLHQDFK